MSQVRRNKVIGAESQWFHVHDGAERIYKVVQQHNLGDVANSISPLCIETS